MHRCLLIKPVKIKQRYLYKFNHYRIIGGKTAAYKGLNVLNHLLTIPFKGNEKVPISGIYKYLIKKKTHKSHGNQNINSRNIL